MSKISPSSAMQTAFAILATVWPRDFNQGAFESKHRNFLRSVAGADVEVFSAAAERWIDNNKFPPTPSELKDYIWREHRERHPEEQRIYAPSVDALEEETRIADMQRRANARAEYVLKKVLGDRRQMEEVFALLMAMCKTPDEIRLVRNFEATKEMINAALRAHANRVRPIDHKAPKPQQGPQPQELTA